MLKRADIRVFVRRKPDGLVRRSWGLYREAGAYLRYLARPKPASAKKFVIFGRGRSGSRLLVDLLDSTGSVQCEDEILHDPTLFVRRCIHHYHAGSDAQAWGFKLTIGNLQTLGIADPMDLLGPLVEDGFKLIHIRRENVIRQFVSAAHGRQTKQWHYSGDDRPSQGIRVDPVALAKAMERSSWADRFEAEVLEKVPSLGICYERDLEPNHLHAETVRLVTDFLGVPYSPPTARTKKALTKPLSETVENFDELEAVVS